MQLITILVGEKIEKPKALRKGLWRFGLHRCDCDSM